jgi:hypothetical protein
MMIPCWLHQPDVDRHRERFLSVAERFPWSAPPELGGFLKIREQLVQLILGLPEFNLKTPQQFFLFALLQKQIIVCQAGILLFEFACNFIPVPLDRVGVHVVPPRVMD